METDGRRAAASLHARLPFRVLHVSGEDLGVHRFAVPDWKVRHAIPLGGTNLRLVAVEWNEDKDDELAGTLTVVAEV